MKATGIIRRIDDLGRVVIPKEIRRSAGLIEGDALEIFVDKFEDDKVMISFVKYVPDDPVSKFENFKNVFLNQLRDDDAIPYAKYEKIRDNFKHLSKLLEDI